MIDDHDLQDPMSKTLSLRTPRLPDPPYEATLHEQSRTFWALQLGGWTAYAVLRLVSEKHVMRLLYHTPFDQVWPGILRVLIGAATGFCLSMIMASIFRRVMSRSGWILWSTAFLTVCAAASLFAVIDVWAFITLVDRTVRPSVSEFLGWALYHLYVLTSWAGLYFGINYYLAVQSQRARLLTLTAQAQAAQLKMLRYQLNPHFLFNTLNGISTLVLLKDTERANAMLTRLSAFLRYTLANDAVTTVPLVKEIETLKLYLDIERLRFEDRLRVHFEIDPFAQLVLIPSLLLQPLVENAIKYGVAPKEEGADITVRAKVSYGRMILEVADTGPGLEGTSTKPGSIGLPNTRERLAQVYGRDHKLKIRSNTPRGLIVMIDVPANSNDESQQEAAE
jgi:two-component system, LytTR family, sensor kinase